MRNVCEKHARRHARAPDIRKEVDSPFPHDGSAEDILEHYVYRRVDKNEQTLSAAPAVGYMVALREVFINDASTFATTTLTPKQAAAWLQGH